MYELQAGASLGKYQIVRKLADGGMAEIYLARIGGEAGFEKLVVLKRILPSVAEDRAQLHMFLDEARLAATLRHANIAEVIDIGSEGDTYFFVMEYVLGQDARTLRYQSVEAQQPIPLAIALAIVCGTAAALAYAHDKRGPDGPLGLVHRDVSPSNILVSYDGAVKLVDFGIARATSRTTRTLTGVLRGKVPYMSPEQCRGKVLDRRSDLFSLGIVLYELTTGKRPFAGRTEYDTLERIALGDATPPSAIDPTYPRPLEAIVMTALQRDRALRYQTADAMLADLEALISAQGVFMSTLGVAKYMRELFAHEIDDQMGRNVWASEHSAQTRTMRPGRADPPTDGETTVAFGRPQKRHTDPPRKRAGTELTSTETLSPFEEQFTAELQAELDEDAPPGEPPDARTRRRIDTLVDRAFACYGADELDKAVIAVELAMLEDDGSATVVHRHRQTITAILVAFVGHGGQVPALTRDRDDLEAHLQRSASLLARIDGHATIDELVHASGLTPLETYRQLAQLVLRGAVQLG
jgi:serine/threonine protein kinase